jgi:hypothetical protein
MLTLTPVVLPSGPCSRRRKRGVTAQWLVLLLIVVVPTLALAYPGGGSGVMQVTSFLQAALDFAVWRVAPLVLGFALLWALGSWALGNPQGLGQSVTVVIAAVCIFSIGGIMDWLMQFGH